MNHASPGSLRGQARQLARWLRGRPALKVAEAELRIERLVDAGALEEAERWGARAARWRLADREYVHRILFDQIRRVDLRRSLPHAYRALMLDPDNTELAATVRTLLERHGPRLDPALADRDGAGSRTGHEEWAANDRYVLALAALLGPAAGGPSIPGPPPDSALGQAKSLCARHREHGHLSLALEQARIIEAATGSRTRSAALEDLLSLLEQGFAGPDLGRRPEYSGIPGRPCLLLHNSLPHASGGYATRSHGLASAMSRLGVEPVALTRPGYPLDRPESPAGADFSMATIDGVPYHRLAPPGVALGRKPLGRYLRDYALALSQWCVEHRPDLLHAASNFMNGLAAASVGRHLDLPVVYEVRGLWELTRASKDPRWGESEHARMFTRLETDAALAADAVVTITGALREEMIARGVPSEKVTVIPNGVDPEHFTPREKDPALAERLGLTGKTVLGYAGTVADYEGLELLVEAASTLSRRGHRDLAVLVVGDGPRLQSLRERAAGDDTGTTFVFTGRVSHDAVAAHVALFDVAPFPRHAVPVCEMVSPMKPFEAMAMGKAVLASDVAALTEIVADGETGLLHRKDDPADLTRQLELLLTRPDLRRRLGESARSWVVRERDFRRLAARVVALHDDLRARRSGAGDVAGG